MLTILHSADWQIGLRTTHAGEKARTVREARLTAAARVVELANKRDVDVLVLAGDIFEDNAVEPVLVQKVIDLLGRARCPVLLLPGNHDHGGAGSVYRHPAWPRVSPHVRVLETTDPVEVGEAVFFPCPCSAKASTADPTSAIPPRTPGDTRLRIGLAHGSLVGIGVEVSPDDFPIPLDAADRAELDVLLLGHWHSTLALPSREKTRVAYSGTHEPTRFGERDSGNALLVTLEKPGTPARVEPIATRELSWVERAVEFAKDADVQTLRDDLARLGAPETTLLKLKLSGLLSREGFESLEGLEAEVAARFLVAQIDVARVLPRPDDDAEWVACLPDGVARTVAEKLLGRTHTAHDVHGREVAVAALTRLVSLARRFA